MEISSTAFDCDDAAWADACYFVKTFGNNLYEKKLRKFSSSFSNLLQMQQWPKLKRIRISCLKRDWYVNFNSTTIERIIFFGSYHKFLYNFFLWRRNSYLFSNLNYLKYLHSLNITYFLWQIVINVYICVDMKLYSYLFYAYQNILRVFIVILCS